MLPKDTLYCFVPKGSSIKTLLLSQVDDSKDKTLRWELSFWFRGHLRGWLGHSLFMLDISRMKKFIDGSATESFFRRGGGNAQAGRQHRDSSEWALLPRGRPRCVFTFVTYFIIMSGDNRIKIIHACIPYSELCNYVSSGEVVMCTVYKCLQGMGLEPHPSSSKFSLSLHGGFRTEKQWQRSKQANKNPANFLHFNF